MSEQTNVMPLIPDWTQEEFMTPAPYEWLYQYKDNKFMLNQLLAKAQMLAKAVKFPAFIKMWQSYVETMSPSASIMGDYQTVFPNQPVQLKSGKYICDEYGVRYTGRLGEEIEVCSHPIMPVQRIINMDTGEEKIQLAYARGNLNTVPWKTLIASKDTTASSQRIIGLARNGIAVNSENSKELVKYLSDLESMNYTDLKSQNSTSHMGWLPDGSFAPYCKDVVYDGESPEFARMFTDIAERGDENTWMDLAKAVRSGKSVPARIALAASFAAPLIQIMGALPFFVHLWGTQGCGKTVGLMLGASVWGNPTVGRYIKTFGGTKVSQELYAAFCGNLPIFLDELQVITDRKMFDDVIYMLCEGVSKGRGAKEGGLQLQRRWSSVIMTTGEMPIVQGNSGGGAAVRTIEVNYGGEPLFDDARSVANTLKENYGFAGRRFVELLKDEKTIEALKGIQKKYYNILSGDIQDKQLLSASILLAADKLATLALFKDNRALTPDDVKPYLITRNQADINNRCYQWLLGYIAGNPRRFDSADSNMGEVWGIKEGNVVYIIKSAFERILQSQAYSPGAFLTWAKRNKKIVAEDYGENSGNQRTTKRKRINGQSVPCVALIVETDDEGDESGYERVEPDDMPF